MAAQIISFFQRASVSVSRDWSQQEIAEFYRVESALLQAGVQLETDRGLSDEGDPWFIFCRADNGEVFIHFARIDGLYVVDGAAFEEAARGPDFSALVRELIARYPLAKAREKAGGNVFVHPAALLIALVGAAFFQTNEARAAESHDSKGEPRRHSPLITIASAPPPLSGHAPSLSDMDSGQFAAVLLSAVLTLHEDVLVIPQRAIPNVGSTFSVGEHFAAQGVTALISVPEAAGLGPTSSSLDLSVSVHDALGSFMVPESGAVARIEGLAFDTINSFHSSTLQSAQDADLSPPNLPQLPTQPLESGATKPLLILKAIDTPPLSAEALAIVSSSQALSEFLAKALPQIDRLPSSLLTLIAKGDHLDGTSWSLNSEVKPDTADSTPIQTGEVPDQVAAAPLPPKGIGHDPNIDIAVAQFLAHVKSVDILVQHNQIVLYDRNVLDPFADDLNFDSLTFTFDDGSTLSLVGTSSDLRDLHWDF